MIIFSDRYLNVLFPLASLGVDVRVICNTSIQPRHPVGVMGWLVVEINTISGTFISSEWSLPSDNIEAYLKQLATKAYLKHNFTGTQHR